VPSRWVQRRFQVPECSKAFVYAYISKKLVCPKLRMLKGAYWARWHEGASPQRLPECFTNLRRLLTNMLTLVFWLP